MIRQISIIQSQSKYRGFAHASIAIDGTALDIWIAEITHADTAGLVPAITQVSDREGRLFSYHRSIPTRSQVKIAPLLVCPDDVDLCCSVLVAETRRLDNSFQWSRIGFDNSDQIPGDALNPTNIGTTVDWIANFEPIEFSRRDYLSTLLQLKSNLNEVWPDSSNENAPTPIQSIPKKLPQHKPWWRVW